MVCIHTYFQKPISFLVKTYETTFLGSATQKMQLVINTNSLFLMPSKEMANLDRDSLLFSILESELGKNGLLSLSLE